MNDEYLWNKTGHDAELEALENALNAYRFHETAVPALPVKVFALPQGQTHRFLKLGFALASAAFAAAILAFIWFQIPDKRAGSSDLPNKEAAETVPMVVQPKGLPSSRIEALPFLAKRNFVRIRETNHIRIRPVKTIALPAKSTNSLIKLTKDEEYAYDRLMLALSITSSKLKIVRDKIDGIDEQNAAAQTRR
jgi:hypothetical protein